MFQASAGQVCMATEIYTRNIHMVCIKRKAEQSSRAGQGLSGGRLSTLVRARTESLDRAASHPTWSQWYSESRLAAVAKR